MFEAIASMSAIAVVVVVAAVVVVVKGSSRFPFFPVLSLLIVPLCSCCCRPTLAGTRTRGARAPFRATDALRLQLMVVTIGMWRS